ncbi:MAG: outer membrane lipoprotein carrier protein LolA [Candidatus Cloacimonetes bacterium]|jgi:outer membrane lipoprotein-sorting protein|nr:outer membrane lipoprotein carrier protein LolA [Candidatus Cloacimonadota bacterium]MCK9585207.1 outer membrane lipoprotein carrier protein LolA [Candidatus Cloacimonadota bacterium]MDY0230178.1 outer membrane lipoprotein carrier protein LolA [Candidatus Cloacimonadaceae bacterium]
MKKISLLMLLFCGLLWAQNSQELYQKLDSRYGSLSSFQAEVKQVNFFSRIDRTISYEGKFYFSGGRMLMSFAKPSLQRMYIQGGKAELYDGSSKTLYRSDIMPEANKMNPLELLQLYWNKSQVKISAQDKAHSWVRLSPKSDPMLKELEAKIDNKSGIVQTLSYTDLSDNKVTYSFSNIVINRPIAAQVWNFSYPPDTQIIEQ